MNKKKTGLLAGVLLIALAGAWYFNARQEGKGPGGEAQAQADDKGGRGGKGGAQPPTVVNVVTPQRQDVGVVLAANGTVTPLQTVDLRPQTTSTIRKVHIKEGQFVKAGQLLFSLDDRSDRAAVEQARAQVARDRATLADLERQQKRSEELVAQGFLAKSAVDTLRSQAEGARAAMASNQAAARARDVSASYSAIKAPLAGRVGAINVYPGSLVQPATSLTTVTQLDPISIAFTLPESSLGALLAAQQAGKVEVSATSGEGKPVLGALSFVDNAVDPAAGTIRVKAEFSNRDSSLWPGQFVNTKVTVRTLKDALVIPQAAIITTARGTSVYVADADGSARQVPVQRLHAFGESAAVSGLTGTEKVITDGKQNLRPGGKVRLAGAPKPAALGQAGRAGKKEPQA
ncbi:MAG TPA: efflux RND transporter periplasmic adaptor subunit [Telluria sp.]